MQHFEGGKVVSFRLPHDTPQQVLKHLNKLKEKHGRKFSSEIAEKFVASIQEELVNKNPENYLVIPYPKYFKKEAREFLQNDRARAMIGQLIAQLLKDPTSEITLNSSEEEKTTDNNPKEEFIDNEALKSFAQKTFLDFDDDDD